MKKDLDLDLPSTEIDLALGQGGHIAPLKRLNVDLNSR